MKFFLIFLLLLMPKLKADEIQILKMSRDGDLERSFVLKTNLPDKVVIDCQSFIQGLRVGEYEAAYTYLLEPEECEGLQSRIRSSLKKWQYHCIDIQDDVRSDRTCP